MGLFLGSTFLALVNLPENHRPVRWLYLIAVTCVTVPGIAFLNAIEYQISARILGHGISFKSALRVAMMASALNQLPIPGAAVVRIQALRRLGSRYGQAIGSTAGVALCWIGTTGVAAGMVQLPVGRWALGVGLASAGLFALFISYVALSSQAPEGAGVLLLMARLVAVEIGALALTTLKFWVALYAVGFPVSVSQAVVLAVSVVLAAATGFFPAGLGIREVIAGVLSPLVGVPIAVGLLATAVSRIIGMAGFSIFVSPFLIASRSKPVQTAEGLPLSPDLRNVVE
jgi:hypothetical protein